MIITNLHPQLYKHLHVINSNLKIITSNSIFEYLIHYWFDEEKKLSPIIDCGEWNCINYESEVQKIKVLKLFF